MRHLFISHNSFILVLVKKYMIACDYKYISFSFTQYQCMF